MEIKLYRLENEVIHKYLNIMLRHNAVGRTNFFKTPTSRKDEVIKRKHEIFQLSLPAKISSGH